MKVIAHRGASGLEPENTIRSFKKAEEIGVDMIEMDVRQSKDGELVIFHDHTLKRLFGINRAVAHMTVAELKAASIGREIPTLDEVLAAISSDLVVEIKVHGIEQKILSKIKNFPHKVMISSFYPEVLKKVRALDGKIPLGLAIGPGELHLLPVANFLTRKISLYSLNPKNSLVSRPLVALLRLSRRHIYVWTVNNEREYRRMKKLGVDGIYTDYPESIKGYESGII